MDIWSRIFDGGGFIPRAQCGAWTPALIRLHNVSDFFIWTAYLAIPVVLIYFASKRRGDLPFQQVFWLFGLFIVACGTTHLMDIVLFYNPLYRLSGLVKLVTAAASWGTVIALSGIVPKALAMRSPEVLEREIHERRKAEQEVLKLNTHLEERVRERTAELEAAYREQQTLLQREQQARREAEDANRAKDEFLATVSHELRTPLNSITGWTGLLRSGRIDDETREEALRTIERSARMQLAIINDILDASRLIMGKEHLEMVPLSLNEVVEGSLSAIRPTLDAKGVTATFGSSPPSGTSLSVAALSPDAEPGAAVVKGDRNRLQQVVWNVLSNAVKFTPSGGHIDIRLGEVAGSATLVVTDSGQGIDPEFLPFVFDRFRQADSSSTRQHGGLGLGLSIVKQITEMHGGEVSAHSAGPGQGSAFTVKLPLMVGQIEPAPGQERYPDVTSVWSTPAQALIADPGSGVSLESPLHGIRVLIVDDDPSARRVVGMTLELAGAEIQSADSTRQALRLMDTWLPDVLVSDIGMPDEDGIALIRRVRMHIHAALQAMPAVALSAFAGSMDRQSALDAGYQIHLAKPMEPAALVASIQQLHQAR